MMIRRSVYGIDFSGGMKAGRKIWIAGGHIEDGVLRIETLTRGEDLPESGRARELCLPMLRAFIGEQPDAVFGMDFPFGLSGGLVDESSWVDFVLSFPGRYASPEEFRNKCRESAGRSDSKRRADIETHAPFSSYNLRIYRQTYYGIRDVLCPLVRDDLARVLPMQKPAPVKPWLLEVCPACTLKRIGLYLSYKGKTDDHYAARQRILRHFESTGRLSIPPDLRPPVLGDPEGDALDSVIAADAAFRATTDRACPDVCDAICQVEGFIYT